MEQGEQVWLYNPKKKEIQIWRRLIETDILTAWPHRKTLEDTKIYFKRYCVNRKGKMWKTTFKKLEKAVFLRAKK